MEDSIQDIKKLICDTLKSAEIAEIKKNIRDCRPLNELCRDAPHHRYAVDNSQKVKHK